MQDFRAVPILLLLRGRPYSQARRPLHQLAAVLMPNHFRKCAHEFVQRIWKLLPLRVILHPVTSPWMSVRHRPKPDVDILHHNNIATLHNEPSPRDLVQPWVGSSQFAPTRKRSEFAAFAPHIAVGKRRRRILRHLVPCYLASAPGSTRPKS